MRIIIAALTALVIAGCASFDAGSTGARTAIEAATLKYIDGDRERAERVHRITSGLLEEAEAETEQPIRKTLDAIEERARERIEWSRLDEAEALVVHRVIDAARAEIEHRVQQGTVDERQSVAIRTVLIWIRDIAQLSGGGFDGDDVETVGGNAGVAVGRAHSA